MVRPNPSFDTLNVSFVPWLGRTHSGAFLFLSQGFIFKPRISFSWKQTLYPVLVQFTISSLGPFLFDSLLFHHLFQTFQKQTKPIMGLSTYLTEILLSHHVDPMNVQIIFDCAAIPTRPPPPQSKQPSTASTTSGGATNEHNRTSDHRWSSTSTSPPRTTNRKRTTGARRITTRTLQKSLSYSLPATTTAKRSCSNTTSSNKSNNNNNCNEQDRRRLLRKTCSESALIMPQRLQSPVCQKTKLQLCSIGILPPTTKMQRQSSLTLPIRVIADWE